MKKINLLILLAISAVNSCGAMANNAKINPAIALAASKLQAKTFVFFDAAKLYCYIDQTGNMKTASLSDEMNDIENKMHQVQKEYQKKFDALQDKGKDVSNKWAKKQISPTDLQAENTNLNAQSRLIEDERSSEIIKLGRQQSNVLKKITAIAIDIAKRIGACGVLSHNSASQNVGVDHQIICVDPAYDITDEVFDTLNKEYKASKDEKPKCNCSCELHCPHKR